MRRLGGLHHRATWHCCFGDLLSSASICLQPEALEDALRQLFILDAIDGDGRVTPLGKEMARLPLDPCLARMLIAAANLSCLPKALIVAAMLSAESIFSENRQVITVLLNPYSLGVLFNDFFGLQCGALQLWMTAVCLLCSAMVAVLHGPFTALCISVNKAVVIVFPTWCNLGKQSWHLSGTLFPMTV